nr:MAG TPA: hypothetical protein [Caudoviricetes sp.]
MTGARKRQGSGLHTHIKRRFFPVARLTNL